MKKELFIKTLKDLRELLDAEKEVDIALKKFSTDFGGFHIDKYTEMVVDLLKDAVNDDSDWIGYYLWELDWGEKWKKGTITSKNGKEIPLKDYDDLWEILNNNNKDL